MLLALKTGQPSGRGTVLTTRPYRPYVDTHMPTLSYAALFVLQALAQGHRFGFDIMDATGLPSGTIYPALRRLESLGFVTSSWEDDEAAKKAGRPRRRNYQLSKAGREQLSEAETRYRAVSKLFAKPRKA